VVRELSDRVGVAVQGVEVAAAPMPAKKHQITDEQRSPNIRKLAREAEASADPAVLDSALRKIVQRKPNAAKPAVLKK
jgi:hypothetical protein